MNNRKTFNGSSRSHAYTPPPTDQYGNIVLCADTFLDMNSARLNDMTLVCARLVSVPLVNRTNVRGKRKQTSRRKKSDSNTLSIPAHRTFSNVKP